MLLPSLYAHTDKLKLNITHIEIKNFSYLMSLCKADTSASANSSHSVHTFSNNHCCRINRNPEIYGCSETGSQPAIKMLYSFKFAIICDSHSDCGIC